MDEKIKPQNFSTKLKQSVFVQKLIKPKYVEKLLALHYKPDICRTSSRFHQNLGYYVLRSQ